MKFFKISLFLFIALFISGCVMPSVSVTSKPKPKWFLNPPKDTFQYFYATGNGKNRQDALNFALNMIASRISVEVSSDYKSQTSSSTLEGYSKVSEKNIDLRVNKLKFNNHKIIKTEEVGDEICILVSVDKQKMVSALVEDIDIKLKEIDMKIANFKGSNYRKLKLYQMVAKEAKEIKTDFLIVNSISPKNYKDRLLRKIDSYYEKYIALKNRVTFYIQNEAKDEAYAIRVSNYITKKGYSISKNLDENSIIVNIDVNEQMLESFGKKILKANIAVKLKDKNSYIENFSAVIGGTSVRSYDIAREIVLKNFEKKIEEEMNE